MSSSLFLRNTKIALLCSLLVSGCVFQDVREQQRQLDASCVFSGTVSTARADPHYIVVVLFRRAEGQPAIRNWVIVDHFVLERPGKWEFLVTKAGGMYAAAAFEDANDDLIYQPGESYGRVATDNPITCVPGGRFTDLAISIPLKVDDP